MTDEERFHLETNAREFTFEKASYYSPLWYRKEVVLADGADDFTELCPCRGVPGGLIFPHTARAELRRARLWDGANGAS